MKKKKKQIVDIENAEKEKKESKRKNGYVTLPVFPIRLHTIVFLSPLLERYWVAIDFFFFWPHFGVMGS